MTEAINMAKTITLLLSIFTFGILSLAQATNTTSLKPTTWHFRGFADDNCLEEIIDETGDNQVYCNDTPVQLQSYRFSATTDAESGETFGLRLYVEEECSIPSIIYDAVEDGAGDCRTTVPYMSWNTFLW